MMADTQMMPNVGRTWLDVDTDLTIANSAGITLTRFRRRIAHQEDHTYGVSNS